MGKKTKKKQLSRKEALRKLMERAELHRCESRGGAQCVASSNDDDFYAHLVEAAVAAALDELGPKLQGWPGDHVMFMMLRYDEESGDYGCDVVCMVKRDDLKALLEAVPPQVGGPDVFSRTERALAPNQRWAFVMVRGNGCVVQSTVIAALSHTGMFGGVTVGQA